MNKLLTGLLLFCLLQSCFTHRAKENESFLLLNRQQDKLMIVSVLPLENDSTGIAVSSIFVNQFEGSQGQSTAFLHAFDPVNGRRRDGSWFIDSLMTFRNPGFPVLLAPAERDSVPAFRFSLNRKKTTFETGPPVQSETQYVIRYPAQKRFERIAGGTAFGINGVGSLAATLENVRGREPKQASVVSLHCFDANEALFRRDRPWYWLDYVLEGKAYHLFFEADASGTTTVHYNISPGEGPVTIDLQPGGSPEMTIRQQTAAPLQVRVVSPVSDRPAKNTFRAETVALMRDSIRVGSGILYKL